MKQAKPKPEELRTFHTMFQIMHAHLFGLPFAQACAELFSLEIAAPLPKDEFAARCVVNLKQLMGQSLDLKECFVRYLIKNYAAPDFTSDDFVVVGPDFHEPEISVSIDSLCKFDVQLKIERVVVSRIAVSYRCVVSNGINTTIINGKLFGTVMHRAVRYFISEASKCVLREPCDLQDAITLCRFALQSKKLTKAQKQQLQILSTQIDNTFPSPDKGNV